MILSALRSLFAPVHCKLSSSRATSRWTVFASRRDYAVSVSILLFSRFRFRFHITSSVIFCTFQFPFNCPQRVLGPIGIQVGRMHDIQISDTLESQRYAVYTIIERIFLSVCHTCKDYLCIFGHSLFSKVLNLSEMFSKEKGVCQTTSKLLWWCRNASSLLSLLEQTRHYVQVFPIIIP